MFKVEPVANPVGAARYRIRVPNTSLVLDVTGASMRLTLLSVPA